MRDEIQAGLKNAIERGSTLDEAIESFISAGYNPVEVKEAANSINTGSISVIQQKKTKSETPVQNSDINQNSTNLGPQNPVPDSSFSFGQQIQGTSQQQPVQQPIQQKSTFTQQMPSYSYSSPSLPPKKSKRTLVIILVAIILVLVAALAGLMFFSDVLLKSFFS